MAADSFKYFETLMNERRSVRAFDPAPIASGILAAIFTAAQRAPSNCNVQPWVVHVASGEAAGRVRRALELAVEADKPFSPDFELTPPYPGAYRVRQIEAAKALFTATGVARGDTAARHESFRRNFRFFDAPHVAFLFLPAWAGWREAADCGIYAQSLMLALTAHGYASCPQGALSYYPDLVRQELNISGDLRLLLGVAFGREDVAAPANKARTTRAALQDVAVFHS